MTFKQAQRRNHWIFRAKGSLDLLTKIPPDILKQSGLTMSEITKIKYRLQQAIDSCNHTYATCPSCKKALTGRNHQFRNNNHTLKCQVCDRKYPMYIGTKFSRMKIPLHEARTRMIEIMPELFI